MHRMGGLWAGLAGARLCFVITSCCLGGMGPLAPILPLKLFLAHLDPPPTCCLLRSVAGHHTAGGRQAQPSREGRPSGNRDFESFGLKSIQIKRSREQRGRERRAATNVYCVPGSMRLFRLLDKGDWTSLTSSVREMAEEQGQNGTEPVPKSTRTHWDSGWRGGGSSAHSGCRHTPRAGGTRRWVAEKRLTTGLGRMQHKGTTVTPTSSSSYYRQCAEGQSPRHLSSACGSFSASLFLSTLNTYVHFPLKDTPKGLLQNDGHFLK